MAQFAGSGLVAMVLVGLTVVAVSRQAGTREAVRDAKEVARLAGVGIVEPNVDAAVIAGDRGALRRLDRIVRRRVLVHESGVVRVKLWSASGRIVYSDDLRLVGARFKMGADERAALHGHGVEAHLSDLSRPENRFERPQKKLLEVYLPIRATNGEPLLFEAYQRFSAVSASGRRLWLAFAPALLGGLLVLQLVNLPLARSLARRLHRSRANREELLRRALEASERERRVIAADLHDGIVQDLAGVSFSLAAQAERLNGHADPQAGAVLREGAAKTRETVQAMRSLLIDIYPPSLHNTGLASALGDLATTWTTRGLPTTTHVSPPDLRPGRTSEQLVFRCAQEALRNAYKHARAGSARVNVQTADGHVILEVADDGIGFDPATVAERAEEGHIGLRVLNDLVEGAGGRFTVQSGQQVGTTVHVEVPL